MRALMVLVVGMGVLIVVGVVGLIVVVTGRVASRHAPALPAVVLEEPAGTRIAGIAPLGDSLALRLQGGGADRVVVVDPQGRVTRRLELAR